MIMTKAKYKGESVRVKVIGIETGRELTGTLVQTQRGTFFHADDPVTVFQTIQKSQEKRDA